MSNNTLGICDLFTCQDHDSGPYHLWIKVMVKRNIGGIERYGYSLDEINGSKMSDIPSVLLITKMADVDYILSTVGAF